MVDKRCNIVIFVIMLYIIGCWNYLQHWSRGVERSLASGILILEGGILCTYSRKMVSMKSYVCAYRPNVTSGAYIILLVPMVLMAEVISCRNLSDLNTRMTELWLSLLTIFIIITQLLLGIRTQYWLYLMVGIPLTGAIFALFWGWVSILVVLSFFIIWKGMELILICLPKSFTFGELALLLQLLTCWLNRMALAYIQPEVMSKEDFELLLFVETLVIAVVISTIVTYLSGSYSSIWHFFAVYTGMAILSLVFLQLCFGDNPIVWLLSFIFENCVRIYLLVLWLVLFAITIVWTAIQGLERSNLLMQPPAQMMHQQKSTASYTTAAHTNTYSEDISNTCHSFIKIKSVNFAVRKVFHVVIVLVYIPGLLLDTRLLLLVSTAAFGLFIILEAARALNVPGIGKYLDEVFRAFVDDRDQGLVFLTHIYLLLGLSVPLWMSHKILCDSSAAIEMYSGVLALGIGDTVACVAGRAVGRMQWPGGRKTVEGTLCSILSQMSIVIMGTYLGFVIVNSYLAIFIGICLNALLEAFTDQIDNLILPLVMYPILCIQS